MSRYIFDIEANGLLKDASVVHCLVLKDIDKKIKYSFANQPKYEPISTGLWMLRDAEMVIGHNILCYDLPVLEKLYNFKTNAIKRDTLLMARIVFPEIENMDKSGKYFVPKNMYGHYSLESFGYRLNFKKEEMTDFSEWSPKMQAYCEQDVEVTYKLWDKILKRPMSETCLKIEHDFQEYIHIQETLGTPFDVEKAYKLNTPLKIKLDEIKVHVNQLIPPKEIKLKTRTKYEPFNPGSRTQIIEFFCKKYDWKPEVFTEANNPSLDGDILGSLQYPEAKLFAEYFQVQKLLGMLSTGKNSWLNFVENGRIHGRVITAGAITRRCTHSSPNLAQIPSARSFLGKEVRSLFYAPEGYRMVGTDAKGIELRCLAHYLARFDNGIYAKEVVEGDIHTRHQKAVELNTRDDAKTFIYSFIYGAGDECIGALWVPNGTSQQKKDAGARARYLFGERIPAYKLLTQRIRNILNVEKTLIGVDGGTLFIRQNYSALNTLLQNAGAVAVKKATVMSYKRAQEKGLEVYPCLHVHDEWQSITKDTDAEEHAKINVQAIKDAGEELGFRCPLDGSYAIGSSWAETH